MFRLYSASRPALGSLTQLRLRAYYTVGVEPVQKRGRGPARKTEPEDQSTDPSAPPSKRHAKKIQPVEQENEELPAPESPKRRSKKAQLEQQEIEEPAAVRPKRLSKKIQLEEQETDPPATPPKRRSKKTLPEEQENEEPAAPKIPKRRSKKAQLEEQDIGEPATPRPKSRSKKIQAEEQANEEPPAPKSQDSRPKKLRKGEFNLVPTQSELENIPQYLKDRNSYSTRPKALGDKTRINIVSEQLCDDVIERLMPSLRRHENCDIIELNPGVGLWSRKLHEAIKPRSHILLEPEDKLYLPYLQPLLDAKDSKYKFIPKSGIYWSTLLGLGKDGLLPHQTAYEPGDPRLQKSNDTLLFVANMGYHPGKSYFGFSSVPLLVIHQLMSAARNHALIHGYGLVRMMIWINDKEKGILIPRSMTYRKKFTMETEIVFREITEVAGIDKTSGHNQRDRLLDHESTRRVLARMKAAGISTPPNRIGRDEKEVLAIEHADFDALQELSEGPLRKHKKEYIQLQADFESGKFTKTESDSGKKTPEYARMKSLQHRTGMYTRKHNKVDKIVQEHEEIIAALNELSPDAEDFSEQKQRLEERLEQWEDTMDSMTINDEHAVYTKLDESKLFYNDPPTLQWDRRKYEPLKVHEEEFFPPKEMALIDLHPKASWSLIQNDPGSYDTLEYIIGHLTTSSRQNIIKGLNSLAPGAVEWLIPRCPSLTDPKRGGCADVKFLRVRNLTEEHLRELFEAWVDWPFKPTRTQMVARSGGVTIDPEDEIVGGTLVGL